MAFLSKTPRTLTELNPQTNAIGPGYYNIKTGFDMENNTSVSSNNDIMTHDKYKKPFNSTVERTLIGRGAAVPGPGSYYSDLLQLNMERAKKGMERIVAFQCKDQRFKYDKGDDSPGPGTYETVELPNLQLVNEFKHNKKKTNQYEKLITSPMPYNGNKRKKNEEIPGPGSYNMKMKWNKNMIDWAKMSINKKKTNVEYSTKNNEDNEIKINDKEKEKMRITLIKKTTSTLSNSVKANDRLKTKDEDNTDQERINKLNDYSNYQQQEHSKLISDYTVNEPIINHYYHHHNEKINYYPQREHNENNFGSCTSRFQKPKVDCSSLGPGEYTHNIIHPPKILFQPRKKMIIKTRYSKDISSNNDHNIENTSLPLKISKPTIGFNGCLEKRFPSYNEQSPNLGPGSYSIPINTFAPNKNPLITYKTRSSSYGKELKRLLCLDIQNDNPPVGTYNTEKLGSIEYKLYNTKKNFIIKSKLPRFEYKNNTSSQNPDIGPGTYDKSTSLSIEHNIFPFGSSKSRDTNFLSPKRSNYHLGPGKYETRSYFDWNKKSYNAEYNQ